MLQLVVIDIAEDAWFHRILAFSLVVVLELLGVEGVFSRAAPHSLLLNTFLNELRSVFSLEIFTQQLTMHA